jgi:hypothetical protein
MTKEALTVLREFRATVNKEGGRDYLIEYLYSALALVKIVSCDCLVKSDT